MSDKRSPASVILVAECSVCGAWVPWHVAEAAGGLDHRHNAQVVSFVCATYKREDGRDARGPRI